MSVCAVAINRYNRKPSRAFTGRPIPVLNLSVPAVMGASRTLVNKMSQLILAAHSGSHDAGAALFDDYKLLAAVQLERLTRYKCDGREHPDLAIDEVLSIAGKTRKDVDAAGFNRTEFPTIFYKTSVVCAGYARNIANTLRSVRAGTCRASFCATIQLTSTTFSRSTSSGMQAASATTQKSFLQSSRVACISAAVPHRLGRCASGDRGRGRRYRQL